MSKEIERDEAHRFRMERLAETGQYLHFHEWLEIYGVVKGQAAVTVSGESCLLESGQMAIVDRFENHSCDTDGAAEVYAVSIGSSYLKSFLALYPNKQLPRWLTDGAFNKSLWEATGINSGEPLENQPELKRIGIVCQFLSNVIERYGLADKAEEPENDTDLTSEIVSYIYEHYNEKITLETLSKTFYMSPTTLSRKIGKRLGVDLRIFVNDIRVQKAVQMINDPDNRNRKISEIAMLCGFSSMSTFYRCYRRNFSFRKLTGAREVIFERK